MEVPKLRISEGPEVGPGEGPDLEKVGPKGWGLEGEERSGWGLSGWEPKFRLFFFLSQPFFFPISDVFRGIAVVSARFHY